MPSLQGLESRLPHGEPFRLISRVCAHSHDGIETEMRWALEDPRIAAHFAGGPYVVPGVLLVEQVAQSALLHAILTDVVPPNQMFVLGQLRCDFIRPAFAPCVILARTQLTGRARGSVGFRGECISEGVLVASVKGLASPVPNQS